MWDRWRTPYPVHEPSRIVDPDAAQLEAIRARVASRAHLLSAIEQSAEVRQVAAHSRKLRETNHFTETIEASMQRRKQA